MKKFKLIILFIIIFLAGFLIANGIKYYLDMWKADRNVQAWQKGIDDIFANDTYGGATPEETFDMYLAALKKGDLELASRYYSFIKQQKELKFLEETKSNNELPAYIGELSSVKKEDWKKIEEDNKITVQYSGYRTETRTIDAFNDNWKIIKTKLPIGDFSSIIIFEKLNNIWKIYSL